MKWYYKRRAGWRGGTALEETAAKGECQSLGQPVVHDG